MLDVKAPGCPSGFEAAGVLMKVPGNALWGVCGIASAIADVVVLDFYCG